MKRTTTLNIPEIEEIIATACAIENIYLSISAYNLGGYFSTGGITYIEEAKQYFNLDDNDKIIGILYIGCVDTIANPLSQRKPVKGKVEWISK
jgi:nitroreductase